MSSNKELQDTVDEQQGTIDEALEILQAAYAPEATRADLVSAVSDAIDVLSGEADSEDAGEDEDEGE